MKCRKVVFVMFASLLRYCCLHNLVCGQENLLNLLKG